MKQYRIHSYIHKDLIEWANRYHFSRGRPKSYLGSQALFWYFPIFNFANNWCSVDELITGPDYKIPGNRARYKIDAYMPRTYLTWLDTMPSRAIDYLDDLSPDNLDEIKKQYGDRLKMVRDYSMHLKRAMIVYYKLCYVNPSILEIDADLIRPDGYTWNVHNFQSTDYVLAYSNKLAKLINVDLLKPPTLELKDY
jgi:hypothetical protein